MDVFYSRMKELLGDEYDAFINALSEPPYKSLYLNPLRHNARQHLNNEAITPHPIVNNGFYYDETIYHPGQSPFFMTGTYYIQEPSAMLVSHFLDVQPDDYVLDLCGAPGGKTCAVANILNDEGLLITNDISASRAKILSENVERFGAKNVIVTSTNPKTFLGTLDGFFDKIILDAPCSGEGMLRTTTKAQETWSYQKVQECSSIQKELIDIAFQLLKPKGRLIYSTCTYSIEENEDTIRYALNNHPCHLIDLPKSDGLKPGIDQPEAIRCYPHNFKGEGHFIALLEKEGSPVKQTYKPQKPSISKAQFKLVDEFYHHYLNIKTPDYLHCNNNHVYALKPQFVDLPGTRILRNGLYIGEIRKNRFIPAHSLALTLKPEDVKLSYSFSEDSEEIRRFIHGETLPKRGGKGYGVIFVDDQPFAFFKESNDIKNLLPKGLRR